MSLSRESLFAMKESALYPRLKRLFESMGKRNVRITHGAHEAGRDLVYDEFDASGASVHVAVVVKRGLINGKASGKGSAAEVYFQVRSCFGSPTIQTMSLANQAVSSVLVVTGGRYTEPALQSLQRTCGAQWPGQVTFWDGDHLWSLLRQFQGSMTLFSSIEESLAQASEFSDSYEWVQSPRQRPTYGFVERGSTRLYVAPKKDDVGTLPVKFTFKVAALEAARQVFSQGGVIRFEPGEATIEYPEPLASLDAGDLIELRVTPWIENPPSQQVREHLVSVTIEADDKHLTLEDSFSFSAESGWLHICNWTGGLAQKFSFKVPFNRDGSSPAPDFEPQVTLSNLKLVGAPLAEALVTARLISLLKCSSARIHLHLVAGNAHLVTLHNREAFSDIGDLAQWLWVLERLDKVQKILGLAFEVPGQGLTFNEAARIGFVHDALFSGMTDVAHDAVCTLSLDPDQSPDESLPTELQVPYVANHIVDLLGHEVNLGPSYIELSDARFVKSPSKSNEASTVWVSTQPKGTARFRFPRFDSEGFQLGSTSAELAGLSTNLDGLD